MSKLKHGEIKEYMKLLRCGLNHQKCRNVGNKILCVLTYDWIKRVVFFWAQAKPAGKTNYLSNFFT